MTQKRWLKKILKKTDFQTQHNARIIPLHCMRILSNCWLRALSRKSTLLTAFFFVKIGLIELDFKLEALKTNVFNLKWIDLVYLLDVIAVTEEER